MTPQTVPHRYRAGMLPTTVDLDTALRRLDDDIRIGRDALGRIYFGDAPAPTDEGEIEYLEQHLANLQARQQLQAARDILARRAA